MKTNSSTVNTSQVERDNCAWALAFLSLSIVFAILAIWLH